MVHGGLAATLLDSAMGCAVHSMLPEGRAYTTLELKVNYVRALKRGIGRVRAIGKVIHLGGKVATAEGSVVDGAGEAVRARHDDLPAGGSATPIRLTERPRPPRYSGSVITDRPPRRATERRDFERSDALVKLEPLPDAEQLREKSARLEKALVSGEPRSVRAEGEAILALLSRTYGISRPSLRVLGARPRTVWEDGHSELFGDYDFESRRIRVWMRTAVLGKVTSYRGLLHTLLHEFCHHLDREGLGFPETPHTRGFHSRVDDLYHLALATPPERRRPLAWIRMGRVWRIDWTKMRAAGS